MTDAGATGDAEAVGGSSGGDDGDPGAFAVLGEEVRSALSERGFATPTEPQRKAIPPLVDGEHRDMIQYGLLREAWSDRE